MKTAKTLSQFANELIGKIRVPDATEGWFNEAALELFRLQVENNTAYRKLCEGGRISTGAVKEWTDIPAVPTLAFKEMELTSIPAQERSAVFYSSGTTEQRPSRHFHRAESLAVYEASLLAGFRERFGGSELTLLSLTPRKEQAPNSSLVYMFDAVLKHFGSEESRFFGQVDSSGAWAIDSNAIVNYLHKVRRPIGFLGTGFLFVHLLEHVRVRLPQGSRVLETGGYKGRSRSVPKGELYAQISERLGIPQSAIVGEYGMCELSSQAYAQDGPYHFPRWARALVVSPETGRPVADGETGLIRVIDLANVWSVLAIQTEDLGVRRGGGFELLGRAASSEARGCSLMSA